VPGENVVEFVGLKNTAFNELQNADKILVSSRAQGNGSASVCEKAMTGFTRSGRTAQRAVPTKHKRSQGEDTGDGERQNQHQKPE
jgi:hypothetical protein